MAKLLYYSMLTGCEPCDILYRSLHGLALALIRADCEREALNKASSYDWPITNSINLSDN